MKKKFLAVCGLVLLVFLAAGLGGCKKPSKKTGLYPVPPDLPVPVDGAKPDRHPILVYWSNTTSERGYIQDRQKTVNPSPAFRLFAEAFRGTLDYGYVPEYSRLEKNDRGILEWRKIDERLFYPETGAYYDSVRGGYFKNRDGHEVGPLMMLYEEGLVRPSDLTVVISDLEDQDNTATRLARNIHDMLFSSAEGSRNAAAIVALNIPFNGDNYKPDPRTGTMITQPISGEKPLYMVVTGRKDAVAVFVRAYEVTAKDKGVDSRLVTTLFPNGIHNPLGGVTIPASAALKDQRDVDRNKGVLKNLWNFRNEAASRIWNLTDETRSMVKYLGIPDGADGVLTALTNEKLNLHLLRYKQMGGGSKNGHRLWQLNLEFAMPQGYDFSALEARVENYRYLSEGEWKSSHALLANDLEVSKTPFDVDGERAGVYVVPRNQKNGTVDAGGIVYFELVLRAPVVIPGWVRDFNDDQGGTTPGRTRSLRAFVEVVLGLDAGAGPTIVETDNELARVPVMLLDIPVRKGRK